MTCPLILQTFSQFYCYGLKNFKQSTRSYLQLWSCARNSNCSRTIRAPTILINATRFHKVTHEILVLLGFIRLIGLSKSKVDDKTIKVKKIYNHFYFNTFRIYKNNKIATHSQPRGVCKSPFLMVCNSGLVSILFDKFFYSHDAGI